MAIQTQTYKKRVRKHSTLSAQALAVALVVADLRYEAKLHAHEPLSLKLADLARECHMVRSCAARYLAECIESGWIVSRSVHRDGHQQPNEYTLADPSGTGAKPAPRRKREPMDAAARARLARKAESVPADAETGVEGAKAESAGTTESVAGTDTVLRSKNKSVVDAAPPRAAAFRDEQDEQNNPPANVPNPRPVAALACATTNADDALALELERDVLLARATELRAKVDTNRHLLRACPTCRAPAGRACTTKYLTPHPERQTAAVPTGDPDPNRQAVLDDPQWRAVERARRERAERRRLARQPSPA